MPAVILYVVATLAILLIWDRWVQRVTILAALVLVLLPLCFTGRALLSGRVYAPIDLQYMSEPLKDYAPDVGIEPVHNGTLSDLYMQIIPWQHAVRHALGQGNWPVWNPFLLCGSVLAANMQAAPYDAINLLGLLLSHPQSLTFGAAMTFFLAGFFTFAFARALGLSEIAALIAAAGYMFNAVLAFFIGWPLGRSWAFLPLLLFAVRRVAREPGLGATALLTIAFVLAIFAGHPESVLHIVAIAGVYGIFEIASSRKWKSIGHAAIAGAVALLVTAISLLPFLSVVPETHEYDLRRNMYRSSDFYTTAENIGNRAARTLFPFYGGQPERDNMTPLWDPTSPRAGSIVVALALAAVVLARRRETWFFLGVLIVTLCAALEAPPFAHLLHELPLFDIALNQRFAFGAAFALTMLAALAVDGLERRPRTAAIFVLATAVALAIAAVAIWNKQIDAGVDRTLIQALLVVELVPLLALAVLLWTAAAKLPLLKVLLALLLLQRTLADGNIYPALDEEAFYPDVPILHAIKKDPNTPFRITGLNFAMIPDGAAMYGLEDVRGYEAMTFERLMQTFPLWSVSQGVSFNLIGDLGKPFLSFLNIRYAIAGRDDQPPEGWRLVKKDRESQLFENTRVLPRAFIPQRVRYEKSGVDVVLAMSRTTDFSEMAWLTVPHYEPHTISNGPGELVTKRDGSTYDIDAKMDLDGWVVVSDSKWPGWRAYIDGNRVETHFANHAFIGVFVPKGRHHLKLVYVPEAFTRGRNVTFATLAGIALFFVLRHRLQKPRAV